MKVITVASCNTCPYKEEFSGGRKSSCGHPKIKFIKPYSQDRGIKLDEIADFCPL